MAVPLDDAGDFDVLLDRVGDARVVILGEAGHGTHEFYRRRALLTRRPITERGFSFVAVEVDWPACARVDGSVRHRSGAPEDPRAALTDFDRRPTWMWANEEVVEFTRWLRTHDPEEVPSALAACRCFEPHGEDPQEYALSTRFVPGGCENEVVDLLVRRQAAGDGAGTFGAWQNAEVVAGAERYYRAVLGGGQPSWNVRDRHMDETLDRLLDHHGPGSKAVVWAHNTHVGDARGTDMPRSGLVTVGQPARERYGPEQVVLVGFGAHSGTVVAGEAWGAGTRVMSVPPAGTGSLEDVLHRHAPDAALVTFPRSDQPDLLTATLAHRAIGVVHHPERERWGNYASTVLGERYDAFLWFDRTTALRPLHTRRVDALEPETYPSGV